MATVAQMISPQYGLLNQQPMIDPRVLYGLLAEQQPEQVQMAQQPVTAINMGQTEVDPFYTTMQEAMTPLFRQSPLMQLLDLAFRSDPNYTKAIPIDRTQPIPDFVPEGYRRNVMQAYQKYEKEGA
jgi:hypothetical protein